MVVQKTRAPRRRTRGGRCAALSPKSSSWCMHPNSLEPVPAHVPVPLAPSPEAIEPDAADFLKARRYAALLSVLVVAEWLYLIRIRARRGHQIAAVAVARKLAVLCWHLLIKQSDYLWVRPALVANKKRGL